MVQVKEPEIVWFLVTPYIYRKHYVQRQRSQLRGLSSRQNNRLLLQSAKRCVHIRNRIIQDTNWEPPATRKNKSRPWFRFMSAFRSDAPITI